MRKVQFCKSNFDTFFKTTDGCENTCHFTVDLVVATGDAEAERWPAVLVPNPVSSVFFVEMDLPGAMELRIEVLDMPCRRVAVIAEDEVFQKGKQQVKIDANDWSSGVYFLSFQTDGHSFFKKIVKQ